MALSKRKVDFLQGSVHKPMFAGVRAGCFVWLKFRGLQTNQLFLLHLGLDSQFNTRIPSVHGPSELRLDCGASRPDPHREQGRLGAHLAPEHAAASGKANRMRRVAGIPILPFAEMNMLFCFICFISSVGVTGNLSLLEICFYCFQGSEANGGIWLPGTRDFQALP